MPAHCKMHIANYTLHTTHRATRCTSAILRIQSAPHLAPEYITGLQPFIGSCNGVQLTCRMQETEKLEKRVSRSCCSYRSIFAKQ
jgi:hypothetical protein